MRRILIFAYGVASYVLFLGVFLYAIGFIGGYFVPKAMDSPAQVPLTTALMVDLGLLALFAVQHSGMARRPFKAWLTRVLPASMERSTYVLVSSLAMVALFAFWQPLGGVVWDVGNPAGRTALTVLYAAGWLLVLVATFLINHFDLFGLRQSWLALRGREYQPLRFATPVLYRIVRHPLYVGWITVFWSAPTMTATHLVFAVMTTAYILVAIRFEEKDLVHEHGRKYEEYRERVPMLVPRVPGRRAPEPERAAA